MAWKVVKAISVDDPPLRFEPGQELTDDDLKTLADSLGALSHLGSIVNPDIPEASFSSDVDLPPETQRAAVGVLGAIDKVQQRLAEMQAAGEDAIPLPNDSEGGEQ